MNSIKSFNSNLEKLLKNIIQFFPNQEKTINSFYKFPLEEDIYIKDYFKICKNISKDISEKNEIIFSEEFVIISNVNFNQIWNDQDVDEQYKDTIWKYLQTLYVHSYEFQKDKDVKEIIQQLKSIQSDDSELDEQTKTFLSIIDNLSGKNDINMDEMDDNSDEEDSSTNFTLPNMPDLSNLMDGSIGKLAQEIVSGLDKSSLDFEDPTKLLTNLMSGNIEENSGLMDLVKSITGKIHDKINSGELNEEHLYSEANNVMNSFNKSSGSNNLFNNIFTQAMNSGYNSGLNPDTTEEMTEENQEIIKNCQNIINKKKIVKEEHKSMLKQLRMQKRRELLKKKLELRKKLEENKKQLEQHENVVYNPSENLEEWNEFK